MFPSAPKDQVIGPGSYDAEYDGNQGNLAHNGGEYDGRLSR